MTFRTFAILCLFAFCGFSATGCEDGTSHPQTPDNPRLFSSDIQNIVLEVDYEQNAMPYTTSSLPLSSTDYWEVFRDNANEMFKISQPDFDLDDTKEEMQALGELQGEDYSANTILSLADQHRNTFVSGTTASFYVIFLDGYFQSDGQRNEQVLGVSIGNTGVIAMFKPVIKKLGATELTKVNKPHSYMSSVMPLDSSPTAFPHNPTTTTRSMGSIAPTTIAPCIG